MMQEENKTWFHDCRNCFRRERKLFIAEPNFLEAIGVDYFAREEHNYCKIIYCKNGLHLKEG
jgi:hypothetical protein